MSSDPSITPEPDLNWELAKFETERGERASDASIAYFWAGARAGIATHNTASREQVALAVVKSCKPVMNPLNGLWDDSDAYAVADAVLALLVPTSKENTNG